MKFTKIRAPDFDLGKTLNSGQVFHWQKVGDGFVGTIGDLPVYVEQRGRALKVRFGGTPKPTREPRALPGIVSRYFALDHPLAEICDSFPKDPVMNAARDFCHGLRIIRQPKWECLATFICSSMKQVAHIRQISLALRKRFGEQRRIDDRFGTRSLRRCALRELRTRSCRIVSLATAPKICARRLGSSAPAKRISRRGRRCLMLSSENNCARCQAWDRRLQIA